jgi:putative restriction endonuclease
MSEAAPAWGMGAGGPGHVRHCATGHHCLCFIMLPGTKLIRRCPMCQTTGLKERAKKHPKWRCNNGHEFEDPTEGEEPVNKYAALFGGTFVRLEHPLSVTQLKGAALRPSDQLSIEELDLAGLERVLFPTDEKALEMVVAAGFLKSPAFDEADEEFERDVAPSAADEREQVLRRNSGPAWAVVLQAKFDQAVR